MSKAVGCLRIGVNKPQYLRVYSVDDAREKAIAFAKKEKKRTPSKRVWLRTLHIESLKVDWKATCLDYEKQAFERLDDRAVNLIQCWIIKTDFVSGDTYDPMTGYKIDDDPEYEEIE